MRIPAAFSSPALPSAVTAAAALLLAGCGGTPTEPAAVQRGLVAVADALDRCVAKTGDVRPCADQAALGDLPAGVELGSGTGQVKIDASRPTRYELTAAADEARFALRAQPIGARHRACEPAGRGGCSEDGSW